jgi:hypothetical protein
MSQSDLESLGQMASSNTSPSSELDTVFSNFFQKIEELPPVPKPRSAKDYLESNRDKIIHALSKGYSYEDLANLLKDCGFSISASTLRRYIGRVKGRKGDPFTSEVIPDTATNSEQLSTPSNSQPAATKSDKQPLRPRRN